MHSQCRYINNDIKKVWLPSSLLFSFKALSQPLFQPFLITSLNTDPPTSHHFIYKSIMWCLTFLLNAVALFSETIFKYNSMVGTMALSLQLKTSLFWLQYCAAPQSALKTSASRWWTEHKQLPHVPSETPLVFCYEIVKSHTNTIRGKMVRGFISR